MGNFTLSKAEIEFLEQIHKQTQNKKSADRIKIIIALGKGYSYAQIEEILLIDERTSRRYKELFLSGGIDLLLASNYEGRQTKLTLEEEKKFSMLLEENLYHSSKEIVEVVKAQFNKTFTPEGLVITLHRLGFSYKKTKTVPAKADKEKQEQFIEQYNKLKTELKEDEKIYFMDAVHPTHNTMPAYAWIKKGTDKKVKSNTGRQRLNINGVYSPVDHEIIVREDDQINSESTINLFKMIESKHINLGRIYIISDNAKYYYSKAVKEYLKESRIKLINLPSYSPNLNLIERLWKFFKKKVLYNEYYSKFKEFKDVVRDFFEYKIHQMHEELSTLMTENFQIITTP